jgi:hypothetical protein
MTGYEQAVGELFTPEQMLDVLEALGLAGAGGNLEGLVDGARDLLLDEQVGEDGGRTLSPGSTVVQSAGAGHVGDTATHNHRSTSILPAVEDGQAGGALEEAAKQDCVASQSSDAQNKPCGKCCMCYVNTLFTFS